MGTVITIPRGKAGKNLTTSCSFMKTYPRVGVLLQGPKLGYGAFLSRKKEQ